jgi:hypothetical protein
MTQIMRDGTFRARLTSKDYSEAKTGTVQLVLGFEVVQEGDQKGNTIVGFFPCTENSMAYTVEKMRALGWKGVDLDDISTLGSEDADIVVKAETYGGETRFKVAFVNRPGATLAAPLDDDKRKAFAQKMRSMIVGMDPSQATTKKEEKPPAVSGKEHPF